MNSKEFFHEAISHCRWSKALYSVIDNINITLYAEKTFEQIFLEIYEMCTPIKGLGVLTIYDITSALCRHHYISIDKVVIIGKGPQRALELLNLQTKIYKVKKIKIKYVDISDVINSFDDSRFKLDEDIRYCNDADLIESYLCNWQKQIKQ